MTNIEIAERVLAQLQDQRDRTSARVGEITAQRGAAAYAVHADKNEKAADQLAALNKQMAELAAVIEDIDLAFAEAQRRLAAAHAAVARDADKQHARNALAAPEGLLAIALKLESLCLTRTLRTITVSHFTPRTIRRPVAQPPN